MDFINNMSNQGTSLLGKLQEKIENDLVGALEGNNKTKTPTDEVENKVSVVYIQVSNEALTHACTESGPFRRKV